MKYVYIMNGWMDDKESLAYNLFSYNSFTYFGMEINMFDIHTSTSVYILKGLFVTYVMYKRF